MTLNEILYLSAQVIFTILLAFHAIVPELKVKRLSRGEQRQNRDKIVLFLKRPLLRAISLIVFILGLVFSTTMKEVTSSALDNKKLETKDAIRQKKADQYSNAIKTALQSQGFDLKQVNDKLIVLRDSLKLKNKTITNNTTIPPMLWFSVAVDSVGYGIKNIIISMYTSGSNSTNVRLYTSYAGLDGKSLLLLQKNLGHFDTNSSLSLDDHEESTLRVNNSLNLNEFIIRIKGQYKDMAGKKYPVDEIIRVGPGKNVYRPLSIKYHVGVKLFFDKNIPYSLD